MAGQGSFDPEREARWRDAVRQEHQAEPVESPKVETLEQISTRANHLLKTPKARAVRVTYFNVAEDYYMSLGYYEPDEEGNEGWRVEFLREDPDNPEGPSPVVAGFYYGTEEGMIDGAIKDKTVLAEMLHLCGTEERLKIFCQIARAALGDINTLNPQGPLEYARSILRSQASEFGRYLEEITLEDGSTATIWQKRGGSHDEGTWTATHVETTKDGHARSFDMRTDQAPLYMDTLDPSGRAVDEGISEAGEVQARWAAGVALEAQRVLDELE